MFLIARSAGYTLMNKCLDAWDALYKNRIGLVREMTKEIER